MQCVRNKTHLTSFNSQAKYTSINPFVKMQTNSTCSMQRVHLCCKRLSVVSYM